MGSCAVAAVLIWPFIWDGTATAASFSWLFLKWYGWVWATVAD
jgi:hypothetical protein